MLDNLTKVFDKASTTGDIATVLVFGTAGFLVDAGLNAVGFLEPGVVGITAASGALGVKKSIEAALTGRRKRKDEEQKRIKEEKEKQEEHINEQANSERKLRFEINRASELHSLLSEDQQHENLVRRLETEIRLFRADIIDINAFKNSIDEIVNAYRSSSQENSDFSV
jgi:uncharacterized membrane protein YhiD involved in acid resistance